MSPAWQTMWTASLRHEMPPSGWTTLLCVKLPVIAAAVVAFLVKGATGAIKHGGKGFSSTKERTEGVDKVLGE